MAIRTTIIGDDGERAALVTRFRQLVVAPVAFDETVFNTLAEVDTAYNFYKPQVKKQFVITGALVFADKDINDASDTIIVIYEASSATSTTVDKVLFQFGMGKLTALPILPLNLLATEGKFINAKTGDDDIHMTIMGYYLNVSD